MDNGSFSQSIVEDGVKRIDELYWIEAELPGLDAEARLAGRPERSVLQVADMQTWLVHHRARSRLSHHSVRPWHKSQNTGMALSFS